MTMEISSPSDTWLFRFRDNSPHHLCGHFLLPLSNDLLLAHQACRSVALSRVFPVHHGMYIPVDYLAVYVFFSCICWDFLETLPHVISCPKTLDGLCCMRYLAWLQGGEIDLDSWFERSLQPPCRACNEIEYYCCRSLWENVFSSWWTTAAKREKTKNQAQLGHSLYWGWTSVSFHITLNTVSLVGTKH